MGVSHAATPAIASDLLGHAWRRLAPKGKVDLHRAFGGDVVLVVNAANEKALATPCPAK